MTSAAGPWTSALRLVLKKDGAEVPLWPLLPLGSPPARLALGSDELGAAAWWVTPEVTASIAPGEYTLDSVLDTTGSPEGWQGIALSEPVSIAVAAEPAALDPGLEAEKALSFARFRAWEGAFAAALSLVDSLLAKQPSNPDALWFRAEVLELSLDEAGALEAYEAALEALEALEAADPGGAEPPALLIRRFEELQERVVLGGGQDEPRFRRGDSNADGQVNISDPVTTLGYLFLGTPGALPCEKSADADDTGKLGLTDAVYVLLFLFSGGPPPAAPFESCGFDATEDGLACAGEGPCG
ncbi:MAG: hypothetical protein HY721_30345 [Planctomycetes bacterium]|nr:hypothetical protein [Planctomycetota bacterium]